jgi:hypothetical protein
VIEFVGFLAAGPVTFTVKEAVFALIVAGTLAN